MPDRDPASAGGFVLVSGGIPRIMEFLLGKATSD